MTDNRRLRRRLAAATIAVVVTMPVVALARLAKSVCPGCERPVDLKNERIDFCPHCGIGLFDRCGACSTRKSAFAHFCHACGTSAQASQQAAERAPASLA